MQLAPLNVEVSTNAHGEDEFDASVGNYGRVYTMSFEYLMRFISCRQGAEQKRLEYRP